MSERRTPYTTRGKPRAPWPGEMPPPGFTPPADPEAEIAQACPELSPRARQRIAEFCRCFDTWIIHQDETEKLSSALAFGYEYQRLRNLVERRAAFDELTVAHGYIAALEDALALAQVEIAKLKAQLAADDAWEAMDK